jgi:hypothetical protein
MNIAITSTRTHRPQGVLRWFVDLSASFRWAFEMRRRCDNALAASRLDDDSLRRIAREVDAWVDRP